MSCHVLEKRVHTTNNSLGRQLPHRVPFLARLEMIKRLGMSRADDNRAVVHGTPMKRIRRPEKDQFGQLKRRGHVRSSRVDTDETGSVPDNCGA